MSLHAQHIIYLLFYIASAVAFLLATFSVPVHPRLNLIALGLLLFVVPTVCIYFGLV